MDTETTIADAAAELFREGGKFCNTCRDWKPYHDPVTGAANFSRHASTADRLHGECKVCQRAAQKRLADRDPERRRSNARKWDAANIERKRERQRIQAKEKRDRLRAEKQATADS